jgi:hypothetical protein
LALGNIADKIEDLNEALNLYCANLYPIKTITDKVRSEVLLVLKINISVFWAMTRCSLVGGYIPVYLPYYTVL